jgi:bacillithiol biosynthesis deacetylase BshB1
MSATSRRRAQAKGALVRDALVDLLCISPHTDDAEIGLGGTLRLLAGRGRRVWVCDLTRGELGSNGTPEERWREAAGASEALGLTGRLQLALPDGFVSARDPAHVAAVTAVLRRLRPRWVITAPAPYRHPDHIATPRLVARAAFMAHLATYHPEPPDARWWPGDPPPEALEPWRCEAILEVCPPDQRPDVCFDVTGTWDAKLASLACYRSQFESGPGYVPTAINDRAFLGQVERWARDWGWRCGVAYAEAFRTAALPVLDDLPRERWT